MGGGNSNSNSKNGGKRSFVEMLSEIPNFPSRVSGVGPKKAKIPYPTIRFFFGYG